MRREWYAPLVVLALGASFSVLCVLVWLSGGRRAELVRRKLRLGGLLLTWTGALTGCMAESSCYEAVPNGDAPPAIVLDQGSGGPEIAINLTVDPTLSGTVHRLQSSAFSYRISADDVEEAAGDIAASDGAYDEPAELFSVELPTTVPDGRYRLAFYDVPVGGQNADGLMSQSFWLTVTH